MPPDSLTPSTKVRNSPADRRPRRAAAGIGSIAAKKHALPQLETSQVSSRVKHDHLRKLIYDGDKKDRTAIEYLIGEVINDDDPQSIFLLLETVNYFENLGDPSRAVELAKYGLERALNTDDVSIQRKAYNIAGVSYMRVGDYEQALLCFERALKIAISLKQPIFEFAVLCNVVAALQEMGLLEDAKLLAIRLLEYPQGTAELDYLHLQNAINGLKLSGRTVDDVFEESFDELAQMKLHSAGRVGRPWRAYVDAYRSLRLLRLGKPRQALELINKAVAERPQDDNLRVDIILLCAQALCALENKDKKLISSLKIHLRKLLDQANKCAPHQEDVLRTLVELYSCDRTSAGRRLEALYLRRLREHIVNVKHRYFFVRVNALDQSSPLKLQPPSYKVPSLLGTITTTHSRLNDSIQDLGVDIGGRVGDAYSIASISQLNYQKLLRSRGFNLAEDWAVAADFVVGRSGEHCFQVGWVAGQISLRLGLSNREAALIEMACRLHDIGKLALSQELHSAVNHGKVDDYLMNREHTIIGSDLLRLSDEPVFTIAERVARHHHEWWNGCGYPDSLKGETIPIAARICAISDCFIALLYPSSNRVAWTSKDAVKQIIAMGGVRLDPGLIPAFVAVVEDGDEPWVYGEKLVKDISRGNALRKAKKSLLNVIHSIE